MFGVNAMAETKSFPQFVQHEMERRGMSIREFAEMVGVSHPVISKLLDERFDESRLPSVGLIAKLAKATHTNAVTLLVMAYPDLEEDLTVLLGANSGVLLRSQRIEQLPDNLREAIDTIIFERAQFSKPNNGV